MHSIVIVLVYAFGFACMTNFFFLFARIRVTEKYVERSEKLMKDFKLKQGATTADGATDEDTRPLNVVFLHPDLGIGGAERLMVDAAVGLLRHQTIRPMRVTIVTNHHDRTRAFKETVDGTVPVVLRGAFIPSHVFGRAKVLCATLRMLFAAFASCWALPETDVFVVDQVAAAMPMLKFCAGKTPILFYCHFPDQCCDPNRNDDGSFKTTAISGAAHQSYRGLFDRLEAAAMESADSVVCNSKFSRGVTVSTFPQLKERIDEVADVMYPPVSCDAAPLVTPLEGEGKEPLNNLMNRLQSSVSFVSVNRYERKKNIRLAVDAFAKLLEEMPEGIEGKKLLLVVAGGYDARLSENVDYAKELEEVATALPADSVLFLRNITDEEKKCLLSNMTALLYTPSREHFGIVPVEAMAHGKPVIAVNHGGPCESVGDVAGILCDDKAENFAGAMKKIALDAQLARRFGEQGRARAAEMFSIGAFSEQVARRIVELKAKADAILLSEAQEIEKSSPLADTQNVASTHEKKD